MYRKSIATLLFASLAAIPGTASADDSFDFINPDGDIYFWNVRTGSLFKRGTTGRSDWQDVGVVASGRTLEYTSQAYSFDLVGSVEMSDDIVAAGTIWWNLGGRELTAGVQLADGSYHLLDLSDENNAVEIGVIPRIPRNGVISDLLYNRDRDRFYLLDTANDRMLHYDATTLEMVGAAAFSADLGPGATMVIGTQDDRVLIGNDATTGLIYERGMGGSATRVYGDISQVGGAIGAFQLPSPGVLTVFAAAGYLGTRRRRDH